MNQDCGYENMIVVTSENRQNSRQAKPLVRIQNWLKLICTIIVVHSFIVSYQVVAASRSNLYDPEQQDGIPVFSARSIPTNPSSLEEDDWGTGEQIKSASGEPQVAQRRQGDADLDDGMEDEEDDEYKSGSSRRESVENPSYGESSRSARDGDEIEEFFDKHLGPPQEATTADESSTSVSKQEVPAIDPDDHYEAAASGPIANIIHSLLSPHNGESKHKKRPFLKIAAITSASTPSSSSADSADESTSSSSSTPSSTSPLPILSLISGAVGKDDKSVQPSPLKTSQSGQNFVETAPIALALAPVTAPGSPVYQEPSGQESSLLQQQDTGAAQQSAGVQEIYIGRRPSVMNYLQKAYAEQQQQQQQQQQLGYTTAGSGNLWPGAANSYKGRGQASDYEHDQMADYARYPIAASYLYEREHSSEAATSPSSTSDDEQTVTYNLSFGGAPASEDTPTVAVNQDSVSQDESHAGADTNEPVAQVPLQHTQQALRGYVPYSTRYSASSSKSHNNYYNRIKNPYQGPYYRQTGDRLETTAGQPTAHHQRQMHMIQHQHQYRPNAISLGARGGPTRHHRDPSDSLSYAGAVRSQEGLRQHYAGASYR